MRRTFSSCCSTCRTRRCNFPPIGFKLGFAGTARADAAAELRHLHAAPGQPRQHVLQLRQFHLQLAFPRARVPRKNVEDQLGAVDHPPLDDFFDIALLRGGEIVIEEKQVGIHRRSRARNFFQLARADQSCGIGPVAPLQNFADNFRARAARQRAQLSQRFVRVKLWNAWFVGAGLSRAHALEFPRLPIGSRLDGNSIARRLRLCRNLAPLRPRVRTSSPTRKRAPARPRQAQAAWREAHVRMRARDRESSWDVTCASRNALPFATGSARRRRRCRRR
jgi:hypothetical protein